MPRIYCAGPLFNAPEREEMKQIAQTLESAGHSTFLPQRDGLEFAQLWPEMEKVGIAHGAAFAALDRAIFSLDVFELLQRCDAVVANFNGRVPDEGTVVEAALAWHGGKPLVLYKADDRSVFNGADNPMLTGLGDFRYTTQLDAIPAAITAAMAIDRNHRVAAIINAGWHISDLRHRTTDKAELARLLAEQFTR